MESEAMLDTRREPGKVRKIGRGLVKRCPWCGGRDLFESWFRTRDRCPHCALRLDRGETDFWIGAWMLNLVGVETVFALLLVLGIVLVWPDVPWDTVRWIGITGMAILPVLLFPVSRTLWLAIDLAFRPATRGDFDE